MALEIKEGTRKQVAAIACAVVALLALVLACVAPSCNKAEPKRVASEKREIARPKSGPLAKGDISIVNAEELYVRLCDEGLQEVYDDDAEKLSLQIQIEPTQGSGKDVWSKSYSGTELKESGSWSNEPSEIGIVLDSLREGSRLADLTDDEGTALSDVVAPGDNMVVRVSALFGGGGIANGEGDTVNSLYASVDEADGVRTAHVTNLRHLVNLDASRAATGAYDAVSIDADLGFDATSWFEPASVSVQARKDGSAACPINTMAPIVLPEEVKGPLAGNGHVLRGLVVGNEADPADDTGLFRSLSCEVADLTLANARVFGKARTGALAASLGSGANVHGCRVVVEPNAEGAYEYATYAVRGTDAVGGLVGTSDGAKLDSCVATVSVTGTNDVGGLVGRATGGSIVGCGTRAAAEAGDADVAVPVVSGVRSVGGLVGSATGVDAIQKCLAAVDVLSADAAATGTSCFGGLAGMVEGAAKVLNCYATGRVRCETEGGGLLGRLADSEVRDCFAAGDVSCGAAEGEFVAGGFVGLVAGVGTIANSTSYGAVLDVGGTPVARNGGFLGHAEGNGFEVDGTNAFLQDIGYNEVPAADRQPGEGEQERPFVQGRPASELMASYSDDAQKPQTHPYRVGLKGVDFPFANAAGIGEIWGTWPSLRTARWYFDDGNLIVERRIPLGTGIRFPAALCYAECSQDYYAGTDPYHLFSGWDERFEDNGDYTAVARTELLPLQELFPDEPAAEWAKALRDELARHVDAEYTSKEDFSLDSMAPNSPNNPQGFSYQIVGKKGSRPVMTIGQKLPAPEEKAGSYRVLRFEMGTDSLQVGYVSAKDATQDGTHYFAYDAFTADDIQNTP